MKRTIIAIILFAPSFMFAQLGVKAGLNFANVTNANEINSSTETGYHAGLFLQGPVKKFLSSDTELLYSKQGYNYETMENTGIVNLDYLVLHQFLVLNFTKFIQVQAGGQIAYLLNAKVDSTQVSTGNSSVDDILDIVNRFDYGLSGGVEVHPLDMIVAGIRVNYSLGQLYKVPEPGEEVPAFYPDIDAKNNLFQVYVGIKFAKKEESE